MNSEQAHTALSDGIKETGAPACQESDPDAWFPEGANGGVRSAAAKLCSHCPVQMLCLEFALINNEQHGIWGGVNTRERNRMRKKLSATSL